MHRKDMHQVLSYGWLEGTEALSCDLFKSNLLQSIQGQLELQIAHSFLSGCGAAALDTTSFIYLLQQLSRDWPLPDPY